MAEEAVAAEVLLSGTVVAVEHVEVVFVGRGRREEAGRGQLLLVAYDDNLPAAVERRNRLLQITRPKALLRCRTLPSLASV